MRNVRLNTEMIKSKPCVYFISDGVGNCKIGVASDIKDRFGTLQVGNANELKILNVLYYETLDEAYESENEFHSDLSAYKKRGEWFDEDEVLKYIKNGYVANPNGEVYLCDVCDEFNFEDVAKMWIMIMQCKNVDELAERYEKEVPQYLKDWSYKRAMKKQEEKSCS